MSDIFISYAREDRARAQIIAGALERQGWSVWWDREILPGGQFSQIIEEEVSSAKCVIVLWSETSVNSKWVRNEARDGASREILVPVLIDNVHIPLEFSGTDAANLVDWKETSPHAEFDRLLKAVRAIVNRPLSPKATKLTPDEQQPETEIHTLPKDTPKEEGLESATDKKILPGLVKKIDLIRKYIKTSDKFVKVLPVILMFAILAVTVFLAISISEYIQSQEALARLLEAETFASNDDYENAIEKANTILNEYPDSKYAQKVQAKKAEWQITFHLSEAQKLKERGEFNKALEEAQKVFTLAPDNSQAKDLCNELTSLIKDMDAR
ncbi:MAG: TIR domain-containing protein, partial [Planctomycetota bacterium]